MYKKLLLSTLLCLIPVTKPAIHWSPKNIGIAGGAASGTLALGSFITWRLLKSAKKKLRLAEREVNKAPSNKKRQQTVAQLKKTVAFLEGQIKGLGASTVGMILLTGGLAAGQYVRVNHRDQLGDTRLMRAIKAGNESMALKELESGGPVHKANRAYQTPLSLAAEKEMFDLIKELTHRGATHSHSTPAIKHSLMVMIAKDDAQNTKALLDAITNDEEKRTLVNYVDDHRRTPLLAAMQRANKDIVLLLLAAGANPLATLNEQGDTLVTAAINQWSHEKLPSEQIAALFEVLDEPRRIALTNTATASGQTPLIVAAAHRHNPGERAVDVDSSMALLNILLSNQANLFATDDQGNTYLMASLAANKGLVFIELPFEKLTQEQKAQLANQANAAGNTPLKAAMKQANYHRFRQATVQKIIQALLNAGANPFVTNAKEENLLMQTIIDEISQLPEQDTDGLVGLVIGSKLEALLNELTGEQKHRLINQPNTDGRTCLHFAATIRSPLVALSLMRNLFKNGANPLILDNEGNTFFTLATKNESFEPYDLNQIISFLNDEQRQALKTPS